MQLCLKSMFTSNNWDFYVRTRTYSVHNHDNCQVKLSVRTINLALNLIRKLASIAVYLYLCVCLSVYFHVCLSVFLRTHGRRGELAVLFVNANPFAAVGQ